MYTNTRRYKDPEPDIGGAWSALSLRGARVANGTSMQTTKSGLRAPSPPSKQDRVSSTSQGEPSSSSPLSQTMRSYFELMSNEQKSQREEETSRSATSPYTQRDRNEFSSVTPSLNMTYSGQQYYTPMSVQSPQTSSSSSISSPNINRQSMITRKEDSPQLRSELSTLKRGKATYARSSIASPTTVQTQQQSQTQTQQRLPWVNGPLGPYCIVHSQSVLNGPCSECLNPTQKPAPKPAPTPEPTPIRTEPLSPLEASSLLLGMTGTSLNHLLMRLSRKANASGRISRAGLVSVFDHAQRLYSQSHSFDDRLAYVNPSSASILISRLWRTLSIISNAEDATAFKHSGVGEDEDDTIDYQIVLTSLSPLLSGTREEKLRTIFSNASEDHHVNSTARLMKSSPRLNRRQVARLLTHIFAGLKVFETINAAVYTGRGQSQVVSEAKLAREATSQAVYITDKVLNAIDSNELTVSETLTAELAKDLGVKSSKSATCSHIELEDWFNLKGLTILEPIQITDPVVQSVKKSEKYSIQGEHDEEEEEEEEEEGEQERDDDEEEEDVRSRISSSQRLPKRSPFVVIRPLVAPVTSMASSATPINPNPPFTPVSVQPPPPTPPIYSTTQSNEPYTLSSSAVINEAREFINPSPFQEFNIKTQSIPYSSSTSSTKYRSMLQVLPPKSFSQSLDNDIKIRLRRSAEVIFGPTQARGTSDTAACLRKLEILAEALLEHRRFAIPCSGVTGGISPRAGFVTVEGTKRALMSVWKKRHVGAAGSIQASENAAKTLSSAIFHIVSENNTDKFNNTLPLSSSRIDSILSAFAPLLRQPGQAVSREEINLLSSFSSAVSTSLLQQADSKSNELYFLKPLLTTHLTIDGNKEATDVNHLAHTFVGII
jgi:hypothetical protein